MTVIYLTETMTKTVIYLTETITKTAIYLIETLRQPSVTSQSCDQYKVTIDQTRPMKS